MFYTYSRFFLINNTNKKISQKYLYISYENVKTFYVIFSIFNDQFFFTTAVFISFTVVIIKI